MTLHRFVEFPSRVRVVPLYRLVLTPLAKLAMSATESHSIFEWPNEAQTQTETLGTVLDHSLSAPLVCPKGESFDT